MAILYIAINEGENGNDGSAPDRAMAFTSWLEFLGGLNPPAEPTCFRLLDDLELNATLGLSVAGTVSAPLVLQGYAADRDYNVQPAQRYLATMAGAYAALTLQTANWVFQDLEFVGTPGQSVVNLTSTAKNALFERCIARGGAVGFNHSNASAIRNRYIDCIAYANSSHGFAFPTSAGTTSFGGTWCRGCLAYGNGGAGFSGILNCCNCTAYDNTGDGFYVCQNLCRCTAYGNHGDGADNAANTIPVVLDCAFYGNGGYGYNVGAAFAFLRNCAFGMNTSNPVSGTAGTNYALADCLQLDADPFRDPAALDFTPQAGSALLGAATDGGDIGARQGPGGGPGAPTARAVLEI